MGSSIEESETITDKGMRFFPIPNALPGHEAHQSPIQWAAETHSLRLKRPWREVSHTAPSAAQLRMYASTHRIHNSIMAEGIMKKKGKVLHFLCKIQR
jgi:hypothetical protein